jgi:hypothetical protein
VKSVSERNAVYHRIRNAKASLDNAEKSFQSNKDVRGELDLMLAEAELQNLRRKRPVWLTWTRRTFVVLSALVIATAGGIGWWWSSYRGHAVPAARPATIVSTPSAPVAAQEASISKGTGTVTSGAPPARETTAGHQDTGLAAGGKQPAAGAGQDNPVVRTAPVSSGVRLSSREMRRLIRSGRQELGSTP